VKCFEKPYPCLEPNSHPTNEATPMLSTNTEPKHGTNYESIGSVDKTIIADPKHDGISASYILDDNSKSNEVFHDVDDAIYEDPGCHKETLYSWFEKGKIKKIENRDIR